jgi:PEP-CTERM motif
MTRLSILNKSSLSAIFFALVVSSGVARAATYDALNDFSITSGNPNGVWSYGEGDVGTTSFNPFTVNGNDPTNPARAIFWRSTVLNDGAPAIIKNTLGTAFSASTAVFPTNVLDIHPGINDDVIIRFTAPTAGTYTYAGLFETLDFQAPTGIIGEIYKNGQQLFSQEVVGNPAADQTKLLPGEEIDFSGSIDLAQGDILSFAANRDGNYLFDSTGFDVTITEGVPEPSTWAMMLLGFAGIGAMTYRRRASAILTA